jgi:hypothetical protein
VQISVANAAVAHLDQYIVRQQRATLELHRLEIAGAICKREKKQLS